MTQKNLLELIYLMNLKTKELEHGIFDEENWDKVLRFLKKIVPGFSLASIKKIESIKNNENEAIIEIIPNNKGSAAKKMLEYFSKFKEDKIKEIKYFHLYSSVFNSGYISFNDIVISYPHISFYYVKENKAEGLDPLFYEKNLEEWFEKNFKPLSKTSAILKVNNNNKYLIFDEIDNNEYKILPMVYNKKETLYGSPSLYYSKLNFQNDNIIFEDTVSGYLKKYEYDEIKITGSNKLAKEIKEKSFKKQKIIKKQRTKKRKVNKEVKIK